MSLMSVMLYNILALIKLYYLVAGAQSLIDAVEEFKFTMNSLNFFDKYSLNNQKLNMKVSI